MDRKDSNTNNNKNLIPESSDKKVEEKSVAESISDAEKLDDIDIMDFASEFYGSEGLDGNIEENSDAESTSDTEDPDDIDSMDLGSDFNGLEGTDDKVEDDSDVESITATENPDDTDFMDFCSDFNGAEGLDDNVEQISDVESTTATENFDDNGFIGLSSGSDETEGPKDSVEENSVAEKAAHTGELDDIGFIGFGSESYESELFGTEDKSNEEAVTAESEESEKEPEKEPVGKKIGRYAEKRTGGISLAAGKKIIPVLFAIAGAAALIAIVIGVFGATDRGARPVVNEEDDFVFDSGTTVSGIDISGRTFTEAKSILEQNKSKFISPVSLSVGIGDKKIELTQDNFDYNLNIDEVLNQIKADDNAGYLTSARSYTVTATINSESIDSSVNAICEENNTEPVNAHVGKFHPFEEERFEYVEEKNGATIDSENLKQQFTQFFESGQSSGTAQAVVTETEPTVTVDFLKENIVELYTYETVSGNTDDATVNMEVSFKACNGSVIEPGADWSFNGCTGDSNLESRGYKVGSVISDNQITDGIGGGLCQSSSTIYVAALYSNMVVVERHPHKWASLYVPTGFDATIDYPNLDLVLKNNSEYQMFLECRVVDKTLCATFWGVHSSEYDYINLGNELLHSDESGYSVKTWREFYKDGEKAWQEDLPESHYDPENGEQFISA